MSRSIRVASEVAARYTKKRTVKNKDGEDVVIYEYSEQHVRKRTKEKVERLNELAKGIDKLRKQVTKDLESKDETTALVALCVALIDHTFERVGNTNSAEDGNFGVTTWKKKHVTIRDGRATFRYVGKSDVEHEKVVTDAKLVKHLKTLAAGKKDNDYLFCVADADCHVRARQVNEYLEPYHITAKDLRGYHANRIMGEKLKKLRPPEDEKARKEAFKKALEETAEEVGHEPGTLKTHYLAPSLEADFMADGKVDGKLRSASCPIRTTSYGGIESEGGFGRATEYEVGAANVAEAVHCLLGSLGRHLGRDRDDWASMRRYERGHIEEELGIIEHCVREYARPLYSRRLVDVSDYRPEFQERAWAAGGETVRHIREAAPQLAATARSRAADLQRHRAGMPLEVYQTAMASYAVLVQLSTAMVTSVERWPESVENAYQSPALNRAVRELSYHVSTLFKSDGSQTFAEPV